MEQHFASNVWTSYILPFLIYAGIHIVWEWHQWKSKLSMNLWLGIRHQSMRMSKISLLRLQNRHHWMSQYGMLCKDQSSINSISCHVYYWKAHNGLFLALVFLFLNIYRAARLLNMDMARQSCDVFYQEYVVAYTSPKYSVTCHIEIVLFWVASRDGIGFLYRMHQLY